MRQFSLVFILFSMFLLQGCLVRTYQVAKDRVDQDLSEGNRGYLIGSGPAASETRDIKRTMQVVEVEFGKPLKIEKRAAPSAGERQEFFEESVETMPMVSPDEEAIGTGLLNYRKYTVEKNDTLQKISQKFFGTTKKWYKIYQVNKDTMKGPDKIYPGQVINISAEDTREPEENLK